MKAPVPTARSVAALGWIVTASTVALVVWLVFQVGDVSSVADKAQSRYEAAAADRADLRNDLTKQGVALEELQSRCKEAKGCTPIAPEDLPDVVSGAPGAPGSTGERGPRGYSCIEQIGREQCRGDKGNAGEDGRGEDGVNGTNGADGGPGEAGPTGPPGKDGADGAPGADGRDATIAPNSTGCPDGQYVTQVSVDASGSLSVVCATPALIPTDPGGNQ